MVCNLTWTSLDCKRISFCENIFWSIVIIESTVCTQVYIKKFEYTVKILTEMPFMLCCAYFTEVNVKILFSTYTSNRQCSGLSELSWLHQLLGTE